MDELAQESGVLLLLGEDRGLCGEALGAPEPAGCPVCQGPGDGQLPYQGKDVVILHDKKHFKRH